jgi:aminoglycoside 3-N-acetyltransferase
VVTIRDIRRAARDLGLAAYPICVHASLRSFGWVEGGGATVVDGLLAEDCTVVVPTFSWAFAVSPPANMRPPRNGWDYQSFSVRPEGAARIYTTQTNEIDPDMGAIPAAVVMRPDRARGNHPLGSFSGVGPMARELISAQQPLDFCGPLEALAQANGRVVLMGVGLENLTLLHLAEKMAGRNLFRRWANGPDGQPMEVEGGGHSGGFGKLEPLVSPLMKRATVGQSVWSAFVAKDVLTAATAAIRRDPLVTHCGDPKCERCNDGVAGGAILARETDATEC